MNQWVERGPMPPRAPERADANAHGVFFSQLYPREKQEKSGSRSIGEEVVRIRASVWPAREERGGRPVLAWEETYSGSVPSPDGGAVVVSLNARFASATDEPGRLGAETTCSGMSYDAGSWERRSFVRAALFDGLGESLQTGAEQHRKVVTHRATLVVREREADTAASELNRDGRWYVRQRSDVWSGSRDVYSFDYRPLRGGANVRPVDSRRIPQYVAGAAKAIGLDAGMSAGSMAELCAVVRHARPIRLRDAGILLATAEQVGERLDGRDGRLLLVDALRSADASDWEGWMKAWNEALALAYRYGIDLYHAPEIHAHAYGRYAERVLAEGVGSDTERRWKAFLYAYSVERTPEALAAMEAVAFSRLAEAWERGDDPAISAALRFCDQNQVSVDLADERIVRAQAALLARISKDIVYDRDLDGEYARPMEDALRLLELFGAPIDRVLSRAAEYSTYADGLQREWRRAARPFRPREYGHDARANAESYYRILSDETQPLSFAPSELLAVLGNPAHRPEDILDLFEGVLGKWYELTAVPREGYTLREHTAMVLSQFKKYFGSQPFPEAFPRSLFELALVLHDVGKPLSVLRGRTDDQHAHTAPLMSGLLKKMGFGERERRAALALVSGDPIGKYLQRAAREGLRESDAAACADEVAAMARDAGLPLETFWELLNRYYLSDAGSYTEDAGGRGALDHLFAFGGERARYSPLALDQGMHVLRRAMRERIEGRPVSRARSGRADGADRFFPEEVLERCHSVEPAEVSPLERTMPRAERDARTGIWERVVNLRAGSVPTRGERAAAYDAARADGENMYEWTSKDAACMERIVIECARENEDSFLSALYLLGREADLGFVEELERRYGTNLEYAKVAVRFFQAQDIKDAFEEQLDGLADREPSDGERRELLRLALRLADVAAELATWAVPSTHLIKNDELVGSIERTGQLYKSSALTDFEGDGVYVGNFGSYRWWGGAATTYHLSVPLAYAHPTIIVTRGGTGYPQAMANVLSDSVILRSAGLPIRLRGMVQWRMMRLVKQNHGRLPEWKVAVVREALGLEPGQIEVREDEHGHPVLVAETDAPPIVWAELCRALAISRFIPASELRRFGIAGPIPWDSPVTRRDILDSEIAPDTDMDNSRYQLADRSSAGTSAPVVRPRLSGLRARDLEEWE